MIMSDWTDGWFTSKGFTGYKWAPSPGTQGIFVGLSDSFSLPAEAPNAENARNWLKVVGSKEGQEAFKANNLLEQCKRYTEEAARMAMLLIEG